MTPSKGPYHITPVKNRNETHIWSKPGGCSVLVATTHGGAHEVNAKQLAANPELLALANEVAKLNPKCATIGPGMLATIHEMAVRALAKVDEVPS